MSGRRILGEIRTVERRRRPLSFQRSLDALRQHINVIRSLLNEILGLEFYLEPDREDFAHLYDRVMSEFRDFNIINRRMEKENVDYYRPGDHERLYRAQDEAIQLYEEAEYYRSQFEFAGAQIERAEAQRRR